MKPSETTACHQTRKRVILRLDCSSLPSQVRLRYGPELQDVAPQYAKQFEQVQLGGARKTGVLALVLRTSGDVLSLGPFFLGLFWGHLGFLRKSK